jgi:hypothetical protein
MVYAKNLQNPARITARKRVSSAKFHSSYLEHGEQNDRDGHQENFYFS